eukprot:CAMPEP_0119014080 /NCGR_PEP_ID=MMETSP1176-20130426/9343_1 /TAXON_ID=265551 /ORGANISM="Synedropsis recta cf, Strain CCMP1620" /LENGTH=296 /DNA_ID=CAMNT_0006967219 /DNA_START=15 /DNA_END=905 /DNA_ORIENTATION=+
MTNTNTKTLLFLLLLSGASAFAPPLSTSRLVSTPLYAAATEAGTKTKTHPIKRVKSEQDVLDLASFRNDLTSPEMMVENASLKSAGVDNSEAAINGVKTGLIYVGVPLALYSYFFEGRDVSKVIELYFGVGGSIGAILGVNAYMGKSVYLPNKAECENRIVVDYAEGLKREQDVGFIAISPQTTKFEPCGGVMACVDGQLRNSKLSPMGVQTVEGLPSHFHIKNMLVHDSMRRQGVAMELMDSFEAYARDDTDAELLTLEVEEENTGAVNLYKKAGFEFIKNPTSFTKRKFMTKKL